jgi:prefoldin subunit 5
MFEKPESHEPKDLSKRLNLEIQCRQALQKQVTQLRTEATERQTLLETLRAQQVV